LEITRKHFPRSNIRLVTNGLKIKEMPDSFFQVCQKAKIGIDWTIYPPILGKRNEIEEIISGYGLDLVVTNISSFFAHRNLDGNSKPDVAMKICRSYNYCPFLQEGKLYICGIPALAKYFNNIFGTEIPNTGWIDIHTSGLSGRKIISELDQPAETCRFCSTELRNFNWSRSRKEMGEWVA
jgi:hypothetical protein